VCFSSSWIEVRKKSESSLGCKIQAGGSYFERDCWSPTVLNKVHANRIVTTLKLSLRVQMEPLKKENFRRPQKRNQERICCLQIGLSCLAPWKYGDTLGLPTKALTEGMWRGEITATYTLRAAGANPPERRSCRNSCAVPTRQWLGFKCCLNSCPNNCTCPNALWRGRWAPYSDRVAEQKSGRILLETAVSQNTKFGGLARP